MVMCYCVLLCAAGLVHVSCAAYVGRHGVAAFSAASWIVFGGFRYASSHSLSLFCLCSGAAWPSALEDFVEHVRTKLAGPA